RARTAGGAGRRVPGGAEIRGRVAGAPSRSRPRDREQVSRARRPAPPLPRLRARAATGGIVVRVLYVSHNHPTLHPGGAEAYALELYEAMRDTTEVEPVLLARIGSNVARQRVAHAGTPFSAVNGDPGQY